MSSQQILRKRNPYTPWILGPCLGRSNFRRGKTAWNQSAIDELDSLHAEVVKDSHSSQTEMHCGAQGVGVQRWR